ncbi:GPI mannosyltransferase 1-like [Liolophura sinensis]|uniref:GPI mannosyltransferase 1-like n=1 Tax=Liolophura sinensis TaxID=3198878 RepID=UPI003159722C
MIIQMPIWVYMGLALAWRLALLLYGEWQDRTFAVKYTDVDYFVFSDAASFVHQGKPPYERSTFRYTPLLAWMLLPNLYVGPVFGKLLFIVFDLGTGFLIYKLALARGHTLRMSKCCACLWLLNPLPAAVSSRGNAESIMTFLVLWTLKCLTSKNTIAMSVLYAVSVHFKIYPVTYSIPFYFLLDETSSDTYGHAAGCCDSWKWYRTAQKLILPNWPRLIFVGITGIVLAMLTAGCYDMYGWDFLEHAYLYHVTRKDIRHNFSVYFYMLYLGAEELRLPCLGVAVFLPQALLLLAVSLKFYHDPPLCCFLHTFIFVTFNKVCTSQYFLWYLCLVPLVIPRLRMKVGKGILLTVSWFIAQGLWLLPAYYLEFEGQNTFLYIWMAGILFFLVNIYIAKSVIEAYTFDSWNHPVTPTAEVSWSKAKAK